MAGKNRIPEENARREKIRELLQMANIGSIDDIQNLFKETLPSSWRMVWKQSWMTSWATANMIIRTRTQTTAVTATAAKGCVPAWRSGCIGSPRPEGGI